MKEITLTELRRNIFQLVDHALATGEPIVIRRKGQRLIVQTDTPITHEEATDAWLEARWRKWWETPSEIQEDLTLEEIEAAGEAYWQPSNGPKLEP